MPGGARQGAGRKRGSVAKRTSEIVAATIAEGISPLEYMLKVLREPALEQMDDETNESYITRLSAQEKRRAVCATGDSAGAQAPGVMAVGEMVAAAGAP